ncbi:MAG: hypothetical protein JJE50_08940, partial [Actinomycetales bacterium]|nr:hypothetical protein [Actinomycetales bacterium]
MTADALARLVHRTLMPDGVLQPVPPARFGTGPGHRASTDAELTEEVVEP